jgi:hypothetical protein
MSTTFNVEIQKFQKINKIENGWKSEDYLALLDSMGLGDEEFKSMSEVDLKEMCKMSLMDEEAGIAAGHVLTYLIKDSFTDGKIEQMSFDMIDDNLWEQFADLSYHERLFNAQGLLRESFNGTFSQPTGVKLTIKISNNNQDSFEVFDTSLKASLVRLIAAGMNEQAVLNRLYEDQIKSETFVEAENILWQVKEVSKSNTETVYEIISSEFWLGALEDVENFEAKTHADSQEEIED